MKMELFTKIMGMTGSEHDGEALAALRKAQAMLAGAKLGWSDVLRAPGGSGQSSGSSSSWQQDAQREGARRWGEQARWRQAEEARWRAEEARRRQAYVDPLVTKAFALMDEFPGKITEWEEEFLLSRSEAEWSSYMSEKQRGIMERLAKRYDMLRSRC